MLWLALTGNKERRGVKWEEKEREGLSLGREREGKGWYIRWEKEEGDKGGVGFHRLCDARGDRESGFHLTSGSGLSVNGGRLFFNTSHPETDVRERRRVGSVSCHSRWPCFQEIIVFGGVQLWLPNNYAIFKIFLLKIFMYVSAIFKRFAKNVKIVGMVSLICHLVISQ